MSWPCLAIQGIGESMIEYIKSANLELAVIIRAAYQSDGIEFFTPSTYSQQLGYMHHPKGHMIQAHIHNEVKREVSYTKEVLFIKSGVLRVDFYDEDQGYLKSSTLHQGDVILLAYGGHGFEVLEECEMIEVKQGPYAGDGDKTRFTPAITSDDI